MFELPSYYERRVPARDYDDTRCEGEWQMAEYAEAAKLPGARVLDWGCGGGWKTLEFFRDRNVVGVDRPPTVEWLRANRPEGRWETPESLDPDATFDLIVCVDVIEHVEDPPSMLRTLQGRLAPGGRLAISTPDRALRTKELGPQVGMPKGPPRNLGHVQEWAGTEFEGMLARTFAVESSRTMPKHGRLAVCRHRRDDVDWSICVALKDRAGMFRGSLESWLANPPPGRFELVVADFGSTDGPWWENLPRPPGLDCVRILPLGGPFSLGRGRNVAARASDGRLLAMMDADMRIGAGFFDEAQAVVERGVVWFPYYGCLDESGVDTIERGGLGNAFMRRDLLPEGWWPERTEWGREDNIFRDALVAQGIELFRSRPRGEFVHRWHPRGDSSWYSGEKWIAHIEYQARLRQMGQPYEK